MKIEGLRLFVAMTPFEEGFDTILDRDGPWTEDMEENLVPQHAGLWVWEGSAEREPDELVGGWDFVGAWRAPTAEELARLAAGCFPLRGHAFPALGAKERLDDLAPCTATAHDAGTGQTLTCAMLAHGPDEDHVADGMRWRDGEAPRGFMGGGR